MKKQFAVIGVGRFGSSLARTLHKMGYEVLAIDNDEHEIEAIMHDVTHAVQVDALDVDAMKALGIRNFDVVIVGIGNDLQASILVTVQLKELGVKCVVAKAMNDLHGKVLEKVGADKVVYPERDMGVRVAHHLVSANVIDQINLSSEYSIVELQAPKKVVGLSLGEADLRARFGVVVLAIRREKEIIVSPGASDVIQGGDILVVLGNNDDLVKLEVGWE
ncbi:MAG: TrkA family potassium uptake protein [Firmicutes bacterium]|nr:TrkA family potassium uptake protein [Bacillota bacterium]